MLAASTLDSHIPYDWNAAVQEICRVVACDKPRAAIENIFSMLYIAGNAITTVPVVDRVVTEFKPKTELGKRLLALRRSYVASGGNLLDAQALSRELRERRRGVQYD
jgi:hypothetical protein